MKRPGTSSAEKRPDDQDAARSEREDRGRGPLRVAGVAPGFLVGAILGAVVGLAGGLGAWVVQDLREPEGRPLGSALTAPPAREAGGSEAARVDSAPDDRPGATIDWTAAIEPPLARFSAALVAGEARITKAARIEDRDDRRAAAGRAASDILRRTGPEIDRLFALPRPSDPAVAELHRDMLRWVRQQHESVLLLQQGLALERESLVADANSEFNDGLRDRQRWRVALARRARELDLRTTPSLVVQRERYNPWLVAV